MRSALVERDAEELDIGTVQAALPVNLRSAVTPQFVERLNTIVSDPVAAQQVRENFISYTSVLKEGRFKTEDYLHAVAYVSFKVMGLSNEDAYARTFPQRHARLLAMGTSKKDIAAYVHAYNKGKLVNLILEQTLVPTWVLNADAYQRAINTQVELMTTSGSDLVRTQAANSILTHLKKPEKAGPALNLNIGETSGMQEMRDLLTQFASRQREEIVSGRMKTIDVASSRLSQRQESDGE